MEGSKRAGTLKGGEEMPAFSLAPQRLGAAAEAAASAYQATRSEVQSEALPAKVWTHVPHRARYKPVVG